MKISEEIKKLDQQADRLSTAIKFLSENQETLEACPFKIESIVDCPRIIITKISELHTAREFMHSLFGKHNFAYQQAFYSCGRAIATFRHPNIDWAIWLECSIEEFPKELMPSEKCSWQETNYTDYNLVCEMEE